MFVVVICLVFRLRVVTFVCLFFVVDFVVFLWFVLLCVIIGGDRIVARVSCVVV